MGTHYPRAFGHYKSLNLEDLRDDMALALQQDLVADPRSAERIKRFYTSIRRGDLNTLIEGCGAVFGLKKLVGIGNAAGLRVEYRITGVTGDAE
ncbi:hypothetical protein ACCS79_03515 [Rhizobium johnstonii]|uniref:hypothetical protein n=1 Tax=Rhizobium johnstonii TaxID=3019933 RepID=UPI003F9652BC